MKEYNKLLLKEIQDFINNKTPFSVTDWNLEHNPMGEVVLTISMKATQLDMVAGRTEGEKHKDMIMEMLRTSMISPDQAREALGMTQKEVEQIDPVLTGFLDETHSRYKKPNKEKSFAEILREIT
jgi:hypothetical protein